MEQSNPPALVRLSEGLGPTPRWWHCDTHGPGNHTAWGCPECVRELREEVRKLRAFAQGVMEAWPLGDVDGGTLQDLAFQHGLIVPEKRFEPCGEACTCAEYLSGTEWQEGQTCFRRTPLLKGPNSTIYRQCKLCKP